MKIDWSFPKQVILALMVIGGLGAYPILRYGSEEFVNAVLLGAFLTTLNVLFGYAAIEYSMDKSITTFFKIVIGAMGIRMLLLIVILVVLIKVFHFNVLYLISSIGIFYIVFLVLEMLFIQKRVNSKQQN